MTAQHAATSTPLIREILDDVRAETYHWLDLHYPSQVGPERYAVLNIMEELDDHLQIRLAATLASHGITA
jgi:hypothetical protein